jgi:DNA-binding response OmpR family regulator
MPKKICIVEDDLHLLENYVTELEILKYKVVTVSDGGNALSFIKKEEPDLVLLDIMLPNKNGIDILEELRDDKKFQDLPVVMLTNYGDEENIRRSLDLGAMDYLKKYNVTPSDVGQRLEKYLKAAHERE